MFEEAFARARLSLVSLGGKSLKIPICQLGTVSTGHVGWPKARVSLQQGMGDRKQRLKMQKAFPLLNSCTAGERKRNMEVRADIIR